MVMLPVALTYPSIHAPSPTSTELPSSLSPPLTITVPAKSARFRGISKLLESDLQIPVLLPNGEGRYDVPVSIKQGEVYRFTAVSTDRIEELEHPQFLLNIFRAGDKSSYLGVPVILPGKSHWKRPMTYTAPRLFGDWKTDVDIPPRKQLLYALRAWLLRRLQGSVVGR
jgi:hypothetical protein